MTWGNPESGKLGHKAKEFTEEDLKKMQELYRKKGYSPKNYAEENEIDFVAGELDG